ncbi:cellulase family glycosylhydrolase [Chryseolinea sp. H1M3-3]|uniref:glycoside hydrolase family 5 protein n=1 Tax=Chryseolinea sp. H1M3-3 TaxID=3034144 RepID=UPI0023EC43A1|nr:cellulase family glycosylhydrolase [Chryseolinea sp. H1M3-3]
MLVVVLIMLSCSSDDTPNPAASTFKVVGTKLTDPCGETVILKGVNKMSVFDENDPYGRNYFPEIAKTNSNCVRIVWQATYSNGTPSSLNQLDSLIKNCIKHQMIPMVEMHDATCNWNALNNVVNYWTQPQVIQIVQRYEHALLVNIANEAGDDNVTQQQFVSGYQSAITTLRNAGIRTPLIIDAKGCGKDLDVLVPTAATLIAHDPDHNVMFSVHPYWSKLDIQTVQPTFIKDQLKKATDNNIPLLLGELCGYGGWPGAGQPNTASCEEKGSIDYQTLLSEASANNIGYLVWEWGPGNGFYEYNPPYLCPGMDITTDGTYQSIVNIAPGSTPKGWIRDVMLDSPYSVKNTSVKSGYISNGFRCP